MHTPGLVITDCAHEGDEYKLQELISTYKKAGLEHDNLVVKITEIRETMAGLAAQKAELSKRLAGQYKKQANPIRNGAHGKGKK